VVNQRVRDEEQALLEAKRTGVRDALHDEITRVAAAQFTQRVAAFINDHDHAAV